MSEEKKPIEPHPHQPARRIEFCRCGAYRIDGGDWRPPSTSAWATLRGVMGDATVGDKERKKRARKGGKSRWRRTSPRERSLHMQWLGSRPRPAAQKPKCACGAMTPERAAKRNHRCTEAGPLPPGPSPMKGVKTGPRPLRRPPEPFTFFPGKENANE